MPVETNATRPFEVTQYRHSFFGFPSQIKKPSKDRLVMSARFDASSNKLICRTVANNWWGHIRWVLLSHRRSIDVAVQQAFEHYYQAERALNPQAATTTQEFNIPLYSHEFSLPHELSKDDVEKAVALFSKAVAIAEHAQKRLLQFSNQWNAWNTRLETAEKKRKTAINKLTSFLAHEELETSGLPTPYLNNLLYGIPLS